MQSFDFLEGSVTVMYRVYGDESHDEKSARVFAVAGLLGGKNDWDVLAGRWQERLGGRVFHAADCDTDRGDFKESSHHENKVLYADLIKILSQSAVLGYGIAIDLAACRAVFRTALPNQPYYLCLAHVVKNLGDTAKLCIPRGPVEFIFDRNEPIEYNAGKLYEYISCLESLDLQHLTAETISFASRQNQGIQMADLLARETMKHLDNKIGPTQRPMRQSLQALIAKDRFRFELYQEEAFEDLKARVLRMGGPTMSDYNFWRSKLKLIDNMETRLRFQIETNLQGK